MIRERKICTNLFEFNALQLLRNTSIDTKIYSLLEYVAKILYITQILVLNQMERFILILFHTRHLNIIFSIDPIEFHANGGAANFNNPRFSEAEMKYENAEKLKSRYE